MTGNCRNFATLSATLVILFSSSNSPKEASEVTEEAGVGDGDDEDWDTASDTDQKVSTSLNGQFKFFSYTVVK